MTMRVNSREHQAWKALAAARGLCLSDLIRTLLRAAETTEKASRAIDRLGAINGEGA
jgi:phage shock protein A